MKTGILALFLLIGCGDDNKQKPIDAAVIDTKPPTDASVVVDGTPTDGAAPVDASCFTNPDPNNYNEIINACTTALKVYTTHPKPPLQYADGGLPPLP